MKKRLKKQINKVDSLMNELNEYLGAFNSILAPRGEGARQMACQEFHELMEELHDNLYKLEEAQLNEFGWDIETISLID